VSVKDETRTTLRFYKIKFEEIWLSFLF